MINREELFFLQSERCGRLSYHNVYSFYDEPIIFTALNEFEQLFFCYSLGCDETHERWIIVPMSQDKVNKLEQKSISIVKAIKQSAKSKVFVVKIGLENEQVSEELVLGSSLNYRLPSENFFITQNVNFDGRRKFSHRIRIAKKSKTDLISETLNQVSERFGEFCRHYLSRHDVGVKFFPQDAVPGSFVYRVKAKANDQEQFLGKGYELLTKISSKEAFITALNEHEIDLRIVRRLFDLISSNDIEIQLIDEESTDTILMLDPQYIESLIPIVEDMTGSYLDSTMVPQADNLGRIKKYLSIIDSKKTVTAIQLGVAQRQVSYYRDACKILNLIHDYSSLTPIGTKIATSNDEAEWVSLILRQFEESECGNLWMLNQKVSSLLVIDESTASEFLIKNCNGLSENTSRRRAQTLKSWVKKFKEIQLA